LLQGACTGLIGNGGVGVTETYGLDGMCFAQGENYYSMHMIIHQCYVCPKKKARGTVIVHDL